MTFSTNSCRVNEGVSNHNYQLLFYSLSGCSLLNGLYEENIRVDEREFGFYSNQTLLLAL